VIKRIVWFSGPDVFPFVRGGNWVCCVPSNGLECKLRMRIIFLIIHSYELLEMGEQRGGHRYRGHTPGRPPTRAPAILVTTIASPWPLPGQSVLLGAASPPSIPRLYVRATTIFIRRQLLHWRSRPEPHRDPAAHARARGGWRGERDKGTGRQPTHHHHTTCKTRM